MLVALGLTFTLVRDVITGAREFIWPAPTRTTCADGVWDGLITLSFGLALRSILIAGRWADLEFTIIRRMYGRTLETCWPVGRKPHAPAVARDIFGAPNAT